jgi:acyl-CoA synthetase (AMP-forming)/AMP-acid ligase II
MYTSGSTGKPKGVIQSHASIVQNVHVQRRLLRHSTSDGRVLLHFPINHVAADVEIGYGAIYAGAALVLMEVTSIHVASLETIERERVTALGQVPVMFLMQMSTPKFREMDWRHVRAFIWGGSACATCPCFKALHAHRIERTGARLITGYGSTEACGFITFTLPGDDLHLLSRCAGKIVPPYEMKIDQRIAQRTAAGRGRGGRGSRPGDYEGLPQQPRRDPRGL